jgi:hypothetical protein
MLHLSQRHQRSSTVNLHAHDDDIDIFPIHFEEGLPNLVFMVIHDITGEVFTDPPGLPHHNCNFLHVRCELH